MINKQLYMHPLEEALFNEINNNIPFSKEVVSHYKNFDEKIRKPDLLGKTVQVTKNQFKSVYDIVQKFSEMCEMTAPLCFVYEDFYYGIESKGMSEPWIEISAKTLTDFGEKELMFLLGKEICNIKLGHTYTYTLIKEFLTAAENSNLIGSDTFTKSLKITLYKWCRISNYSSDCFGYLMCKSISESISAIMKIILNSNYLVKNINTREYIKQAEAINELDDKIYNYTKLDEQIPYGPFRIKNIISYASSERGIIAYKNMR